MTESMSTILALIGTELVVLLIVLLLLSWFGNRAARRRDAKAIQALVARVRQGKADRETVLRRFLEQRVGLSGDALTASTAALLRAELTVLHRFAGVYRTRDSGSAALFDIDLQAAVEPYHGLSADAGAEPAPTSLDVEVDTSEINALREENARLSDELKITMETMSRMLNEYSTMFSGGEPGDLTPIGPPAATVAATVAAAVGDEESTRPPVAEPDADPTPDDAIEVVVHEEPPSSTSATRAEAMGEGAPAQTDGDVTVEPAVDEAADPATEAKDADDMEEAARRSVAGPDADQTLDEEIEVVVDAQAPPVGPAPGAGVVRETAQGDVDSMVELAFEDDADRASADTGLSTDALHTSMATDSEVRGPQLFDDLERPEAAAETSPVPKDPMRAADSVRGGEDEGLFAGDGPTAEAASIEDKGADVEAVSEMLVAGDSELLTAEGTLFAEPDQAGLFDEDESLFDERGPQGEALPEDAVDAFDDVDDLFDTNNPASATPEKAGHGSH